ncbi:MAG: hypothetical protein K2W78_10975 [Xanthobacteraceae bacterium]|nr:hypothetical protein [Xanthobacteraceae bacterium]
MTSNRDKAQTGNPEKIRETDAPGDADDFAPFAEPRGTLGLGLPNEGLADRIEKMREDERRNR